MPTIVKIEMPCPKTPEMQTSQMAPTSMCPRQNSWPWIGFWERGHFIFWFQGLAAGASHCCWEALIKSISQICYENLRAEDLGAAQRTPDNGSKTAVAAGVVHRSVTPMVLCHMEPWECLMLHHSTTATVTASTHSEVTSMLEALPTPQPSPALSLIRIKIMWGWTGCTSTVASSNWGYSNLLLLRAAVQF